MIKSKCVTLWFHSFKLLCAHFSLRTQMGHWREAQTKSPTKIFESISSKRSLDALGDSRGKKIERFTLVFVMVSVLHIFVSLVLWECCQRHWTELPGQQKRSLYFLSVLALLSQGLRWPSIGQADKHKELLVEALTKQSSSVCQLSRVY